MISEHTKLAICALIEVDTEATDAERERVKIALTGARPQGRTIRIREAARILGISRNTVTRMANTGRLSAIRDNGRLIGVTEASLAKV